MVNLTKAEIDYYWDTWVLWVATGRKFLPSQLRDEPHQPLSVLLEIDDIYERIVEQLREDKTNDGRVENPGIDPAG